MTAPAPYSPLVAVLQGLRAHDERIAQRLLLTTRTTSVMGLDADADADENSVGSTDVGAGEGDLDTSSTVGGEGQDSAETETAGGQAPAPVPEEDADGGLEGGAAAVDGQREKKEKERKAQTPLWRFSLPKNPDVTASFLRTRVLQPDSEVWLTGLNALRIWVEENGTAHVPLDGTVALGEDGDRLYTLGSWISEQRRAFRAGTLKPGAPSCWTSSAWSGRSPTQSS
ncbi:helicase associated domain-containing protein [Streptomyces sp. NPDC059788]|uniref:helicase associated domain-containing protein n=1 Tax=Streptomyces sp. NPDC059788 TaxID=3346948 RepID=UPI003662565D